MLTDVVQTDALWVVPFAIQVDLSLYKKASRGSQRESEPDSRQLKKSCCTRIDVGQTSRVRVKVSLWWSDP